MQTLTYSYTRSHLLETIQQVTTSNHPVCISRKGQTEAVLMSAQQFEQIKSEQNSFATRLTNWRMLNHDLMVVDDDFCPERQQDTGRAFSW
jgi:PHD/YefM family antitoxin component YafN of YafNO toxin-antitoxin module